MWPLKWDDYIFAFAQKLLQFNALKGCLQNYKSENACSYSKSYFGGLQKMCNENLNFEFQILKVQLI